MEEEKIDEIKPAEEVKPQAERPVSPFRDSPDSKWYVLHTFSGYENVAKENLETVVEKFNLQDRIFDIIIPMEDVIEEKKWQEKTCFS